MILQPNTIDGVQQSVRAAERILPRGGGTKPALSTPPEGVTALELSGLRGVTEYEPEEFTFTALAGTPLAEVNQILAEYGQNLPFDPPLAGRGATLGGTVASGLSGPGRYQYGGVRDFLLGARYVDGEGNLIYGGGQVVKNAAGFDLPKLMVSSLGRFGVLVELTFKVFPKPEAYASLRLDVPQLKNALEALYRLSVSPLDLHAIEIIPSGEGAILWVRLAGLSSAMPSRLDGLRAYLGGGEIVQGRDEGQFWHEMTEFTWVPQGWLLVKVPLTPKRIPGLDVSLMNLDCLRRYSGGGQLAWIALPQEIGALDEILLGEGLSGLILLGSTETTHLGIRNGGVFAQRVKAALDPTSRFLEF